MKRAALLTRVSTGNQKKGSSPEDQLDRIRAYAQKQGYEIVDQGLDVISGSFILARTTFNRYLEMMSEGQLDVAVWNSLVELVLDENTLFGKIEAEQVGKKTARRFLEHSIAKLEAKNQADQAGLDKLLDLYLSNEMNKDKYLARKKKIKQAIQERKEEIASLYAQLGESKPLSPGRQAELKLLRKAISSRLEGATFEQKSHLLDIL